MIRIKSEEEIAVMAQSGEILSEVLWEVVKAVRPGVSELELDSLAEELIIRKGGEPAFKRVTGYKHTICVSTNDVVVHGIPTKYKLKEGDVVGIDCGVYLDGFNTDMAETVRVQSAELRVENEDKISKFLKTGQKALAEAIKEAKPGNHVGDISRTIQRIVEKEAEYYIVRSLVGHGVGRSLHEEPEIPGYLAGKIGNTPLLRPAMTIAIEVIYNMGTREVMYGNSDGWTIKSADGSLSGVFERTVLIGEQGPLVLTP